MKAKELIGDLAKKLSGRQRLMIVALWENRGTVRYACVKAGICHSTHYDWKKENSDYAAALEVVTTALVDLLESEAERRAAQGLVRKKFTGKGEPVMDPETGEQYVEREFSDPLLMFLLKGLRPEKYRDNVNMQAHIEHAGKVVIQLPPTDKQ